MATSDNNQHQIQYNEHRIFESIYEMFEIEFLEIGKYIAFSRNNFNTYSNKIHELHLRVCSEVENILKIVIHKHFVSQDDINRQWETEKSKRLDEKGKKDDYETLKSALNRKGREDLDKNLFGFPDFSFYYNLACRKFNLDKKVVSFQISVSPDPQFDMLQPFIASENRSIPSWWTSYNKIKHNKILSYDSCTLGDLVNAMAGLYILMNYLMKYWTDNIPVCDPNYFREHPDRTYSGHNFWGFPSKIYQTSCANQPILFSLQLPYELSIAEHAALLKTFDQRIDEMTTIFEGDDTLLSKMDIKENCIFHTYFDYMECFSLRTNSRCKQLQYYGKFVN
jgi:hypothetical protein